MTKIKGWRNKFIRSKEPSLPNCNGKVCWSCCSCSVSFIMQWDYYCHSNYRKINCTETSRMSLCLDHYSSLIKSLNSSSPEGTQKNLSAFCSNMLDEYLESEAQNISERAAAFSTHSEDSVAYQLPAKSSSYVKTLDSALKHREAASRLPVEGNKPCPLSYKPLLYSALMSPTPPLARPVQDRAPSTQQSASSDVQPGAQR